MVKDYVLMVTINMQVAQGGAMFLRRKLEHRTTEPIIYSMCLFLVFMSQIAHLKT